MTEAKARKAGSVSKWKIKIKKEKWKFEESTKKVADEREKEKIEEKKRARDTNRASLESSTGRSSADNHQRSLVSGRPQLLPNFKIRFFVIVRGFNLRVKIHAIN